jgi:hypothetical protein
MDYPESKSLSKSKSKSYERPLSGRKIVSMVSNLTNQLNSNMITKKEFKENVMPLKKIIRGTIRENINSNSHTKKIKEEQEFLTSALHMINTSMECKKRVNLDKCTTIKKDINLLLEKKVMYIDDYTSFGDIMQRIKDL